MLIFRMLRDDERTRYDQYKFMQTDRQLELEGILAWPRCFLSWY